MSGRTRIPSTSIPNRWYASLDTSAYFFPACCFTLVKLLPSVHLRKQNANFLISANDAARKSLGSLSRFRFCRLSGSSCFLVFFGHAPFPFLRKRPLFDKLFARIGIFRQDTSDYSGFTKLPFSHDSILADAINALTLLYEPPSVFDRRIIIRRVSNNAIPSQVWTILQAISF